MKINVKQNEDEVCQMKIKSRRWFKSNMVTLMIQQNVNTPRPPQSTQFNASLNASK